MYPLRGIFSEGLGTGHHGGGHHRYIVGVWEHLVRGMGLRVLFRYRVNQNQAIYWTQGGGGGGGFFVLIQNH